MKKSFSYYEAIATMVGQIIGAGIFALPFVVYKSGIVLFFVYFLILFPVIYYIHKIYAEIILSTREKHRIPGYAGKYYGKKLEGFALFVSLVAKNFSNLAYIILGAIFLKELCLSCLGENIMFYAGLLVIFGALATFGGVKTMSEIELFMTVFLFFVIGVITASGMGYVEADNYTVFNVKNALLPYGPLMFALIGAASVPVVCEILEKEKEKIKGAVFWGTLIPALITLIFTVVVVGVTGKNTTPDSMAGLSGILGPGVVKMALAFGFLSIITSFLMNIQAVRETYWWDLKIDKHLSWFLAVIVPFLLYLAGFKNITTVVGFTGAVAGGVIGIIYIMLAFKVKKSRDIKPEFENKINIPIAVALSSVFILGFIYQVWEMI